MARLDVQKGTIVPATLEDLEPQDEEIVTDTEIIPFDGLASKILELRTLLPDGTWLPIHEQYLESLWHPDMQEALSNAYYGVVPRSLKEYAGEDIKVLGMILFEHGPYRGKDKLMHPGYFQPQLLTDMRERDAKGNERGLIVLKSAAAGVAMHVLNIIRRRGWWLFDEPQTYRVQVSASGRHHIYNTSHDLLSQLRVSKIEK